MEGSRSPVVSRLRARRISLGPHRVFTDLREATHRRPRGANHSARVIATKSRMVARCKVYLVCRACTGTVANAHLGSGRHSAVSTPPVGGASADIRSSLQRGSPAAVDPRRFRLALRACLDAKWPFD